MFAVCFGLQLLGRTMGVRVINDPPHREVGSFEVDLTDDASKCELFGDLPARIWVQQGHNDRLTELPDGAVRLARSKNAPVQAMRVIGKPIWATQFHPELTRQDNAIRYRRYIRAYGGGYDDESQDPVLSTLRDTPYPTSLLRRFGEMVLSGKI
jgi:GMP synthase (glutamine-hydrolysing)